MIPVLMFMTMEHSIGTIRRMDYYITECIHLLIHPMEFYGSVVS